MTQWENEIAKGWDVSKMNDTITSGESASGPSVAAYTHSALETLTRLRNLGVPQYLLADALKGVISQKLLPRIHAPSAEAVGESDPVVQRLCQRGILDGPSVAGVRRGRETEDGPPGGEQGRIGMFEILSISDALSDLIEHDAPRSEIAGSMAADSFFAFEKYARLLLESGHVAPEQVERVLPKKPRLG